MRVHEIMKWLASRDPYEMLGIDDGGLALTSMSEASLEIGGMRERMTAEEFLAKFPKTEHPMDGCLEDLACPNCGSRDRIVIVGEIEGFMTDEGSDRDGDFEYDDSANCRCAKCDHTGIVAQFTIEDLDEAISERNLSEEPAKPVRLRGMAALRATPVKDLTPEQCRKLMYHHHGGSLSVDRRKAYLLKASGKDCRAYFSAEEVTRLRALIKGGI